MRTADEIRAHLENLRWALQQPCNCAATGHAEECRIGGLLMRANGNALLWVLGEGDYQRVVDHFRREVQARETDG